ncbi:MAG: T9SS type A sorting domain-containing protein [Fluviicola sp.]|nr:T9SS type A sorting domain-containing protein [Fluviicola sp.]
MKQLILIFSSVIFITFTSSAQVCNLFFSEYLEGASNNKAIEFYNPLNVTVNLTDYALYRYNNGSPTPTDSLFPQGTLAPGAVFVAGNPSAVAGILAVSDTLHTITFFNGDDAMELRYRPTNTTLDIIGIIGVDPGVNWAVGSGATSEFTLVRMFSHTDGELNWAVSATEWDVYPQNTTTFLGSHSGAPCCLANNSSLSASACSSYTWAENGTTYTTSGAYNDTLTNVSGCDSIITLNLTINLPTSSNLSATACNSYTWAENGVTYFSAGNYNDTLTNVAGCDSIITLNLTINQPTSSSLTEIACGSYSWAQNGVSYFVSGSYNDTIPNANGCDSIITLNLTVNPITSSSETVSACDSYTWSANGVTYTTSGQHSQPFLSAAGCDSMVTINLTIIQTPTANATDDGLGTLTGSGGSPVQWIDCGTNTAIAGATSNTFSPTVNGSYAIVVGNGNGCSDTSACLIVDYIGLSENATINAVIYPNPTTNEVKINFTESSATLIIRDAQGKILQIQTIENSAAISLVNVQTGIYFFELTTEQGKVVKRVVKN